MSTRQDAICSLALSAGGYNLDGVIETIVTWTPSEIRESLITLYFFASNAAIHAEALSEEQKDSFYALQQIIEALENADDAKGSKLSITVK